MSVLPSLEQAAASTQSLNELLSVLFEPSPPLEQHLVPSLSSRLAQQPASSYSELVDLSQGEISSWTDDEKADFISGHPRIGEVSNLSKLSANEQAGRATPPEVLAKLGSLNALYESCYPGLRYITYVAGRSRAEVAQDMENLLMHGTGAKDEEGAAAPPTATHPAGSEEWKAELERALQDIYLIAKARLKGMEVE